MDHVDHVGGLISALKKKSPAAMAQMHNHGGRIGGKPVVSDKNPKATESSLAQVGYDSTSGPARKRYERMLAREKSKK